MFTLWKRVAEMCGCGGRAVAGGRWGRGRGEKKKNDFELEDPEVKM